MVPDQPATTSPSAVFGRASPVSPVALAVLVVGWLALLCLVTTARPKTSPGKPEVLAGETVRVAPGESIQSTIDSAGPGATVVIGTGVHRGQSVTPLDDMTLRGEAGAVLDGVGAPLPYAIYGAAANVTVANLEIRSYTKPIWGPNNYRHQGAIHGADMNTGGGFIAIASNWTIENNNIHHNTGWGVSPGDDFHVVGNSLHHNGMAGIGGGDFNGGLIEGNDIFDNNDPSNSFGDFNHDTGRPWDWAWNAAGIKVAAVNCRSLASTGACSSGTPLVISDNTVHDNHGVGIWCDINCNDVVIESNLVERNIGADSVGIFYEISQNGTIRNNVVRDQGNSGDYLSPSGILVWSSDTVLVEGNRVENTKNAIVGNARPREFSRTLRNLTVRNNEVLTAGVSTRLGIATDTSTDFKTAGNTFVDNWFDQPSLMSFWWTDVSRSESSLSLDQWQALGFTTATASPGSPTVPPRTGPAAAAPSTPASPQPAQTPADSPLADPAPVQAPASTQAPAAIPAVPERAAERPAATPRATNPNAMNPSIGATISTDRDSPAPSTTTADEPPAALAFVADDQATAPERMDESESNPDLAVDMTALDTSVVTLDSDERGIAAELLTALGVLILALTIWLTGSTIGAHQGRSTPPRLPGGPVP